jgi:hypothetical protein
MVEHRLAVHRRQFPAAEHAERVWIGPAHHRGDLVGGVDGERSNVLILDGKRQRPFLSKLSELLSVLLDTAISLNPVCRRHVRSRVWRSGDYIKLGMRGWRGRRGCPA